MRASLATANLLHFHEYYDSYFMNEKRVLFSQEQYHVASSEEICE